MTYIASTYIGSGQPFRGNFSGELFWLSGDFLNVKRIFFPPYVAAVDRYPSPAKADNRLHLVGGHTANLVIDEENRCWRQGMPTMFQPEVTTGAGATPQLAYLRTYDEVSTERGPLSPGTDCSGDLNRAWINLPTEFPQETLIMEGTVTVAGGTVTGSSATNFDQLRPGDRIANAADLTRWARVRSVVNSGSMVIDDLTMAAGPGASLVAKVFSRASHIELWLAVNGNAPRFNMRVRVGTLTVSESTATLALGEAELTSFEAMPTGTISVHYNTRNLVAGVEGHLDSLYLSAIGFPERHEGLVLKTAYGEPIIGLVLHKKIGIAITPVSLYRFQGFSDEDFSLLPEDPEIGGLGHHCNWRDENGNLHIPNQNSIKIYNGATHDGIPTRRSEWVDDAKREILAFENGFSAYNKTRGVGIFVPRFKHLSLPERKAQCYVANNGIVPSQDGGITLPDWTSDTHGVPDNLGTGVVGGHVTFMGYLAPAGSTIGHFYYGSDDGRIFQEDPDDNTPFHTDAVVAFFHNLVGEVGGERIREGKKWIRIWIYLVAELFAWRLRCWLGDEFAYPPDFNETGLPNIAIPGMQKDNTPASQSTSGRKTLAAEVVHTFPMGQEARGATVELRLYNPRKGIIIGYGAEVAAGTTKRGVYIDTNDPG